MQAYRVTVSIFSILLCALIFAACEHDRISGSNQQQPTLANIQASVLTPSCATPGCHVPGGSGPMPLRNTQESFNNLVNQASVQVSTLQRVSPGDPANSYLILKLKGDSRIQFDRMPLGGNRLGDSEIALIEQWITDGAQNN